MKRLVFNTGEYVVSYDGKPRYCVIGALAKAAKCKLPKESGSENGQYIWALGKLHRCLTKKYGIKLPQLKELQYLNDQLAWGSLATKLREYKVWGKVRRYALKVLGS